MRRASCEGEALMPVLTQSFRRIAATLDRFEGGQMREVLTLGAVSTFVTGWLLARLPAFPRRRTPSSTCGC
jgi:LysR family transcriptional regulator of beta-lactamase